MMFNVKERSVLIAVIIFLVGLGGCVTKGSYLTQVAEKDALAQRLEQEQQKAANLGKELKESKDRLEETMRQAAEKEKDLGRQITQANTELEEAKKKASEKEEGLSKQLSMTKSELEESRRASLEKERELTGKAEALDQLLASNRQAGNKTEVELKGQIAGLKEELEKTRQSKAALASQSEGLTKGLSRAQAELEDIRKSTSSKESDLAKQLSMTRSELEETKRAFLEKEHGLLTKTKGMEQELDSLRDAGIRTEESLKAQAGGLKDESAKKDQEISLLKQQLADQIWASEQMEGTLRTTAEEASAKDRELNERTMAHSELIKNLEKEISEGRIKISQIKDRLSVGIIDKILFASGSDLITSEGKGVLEKISEALKNIKEHNIRIEGHTDNVTIGSKLIDKFPSNWELSAARATQVVRYLEKVGVDSEKMSAMGMSRHRPVASNDTPEGRQQNRRIEITIIPSKRKGSLELGGCYPLGDGAARQGS